MATACNSAEKVDWEPADFRRLASSLVPCFSDYCTRVTTAHRKDSHNRRGGEYWVPVAEVRMMESTETLLRTDHSSSKPEKTQSNQIALRLRISSLPAFVVAVVVDDVAAAARCDWEDSEKKLEETG